MKMLCFKQAPLGLLLCWAVAACGDTQTPEPEARAEWPTLECDPLVPGYCAYPFPSNVFSTDDAATPTGRRVMLGERTMPVDYYGRRPLPDVFNSRLDGFSSGVPAMAHFPGLSRQSVGQSGAADSTSIGASLEDDSPTVLLEVETGERIPHWVDVSATGAEDGQETLMIRPAVRLKDAHRYIAAIRGIQVEGDDGALASPSPVFVALRDGTEHEDPSVDARRALYADIFSHLERAGIARADLQLAWDYTTASRENNTDWILHMRDEALAIVGDAGPPCEITSVEDDWETENIALRIFGEFEVPLYLDNPDPGGQLVFGADGMPDPNPARPTERFAFEVLIPHSATPQSPGALLQYGHGLLGEKEQIESGHFLTFINEYNYALFAVDFVGFEAEDEIYIGSILDGGRQHDFSRVVDRQHQGLLNSLLAMRMMKTCFAAHPDYGPLVDAQNAYYHGISQGGIMGGSYMALTTDVTRGALGVMGMPYNLLLTRSVDFDPFFDLIRANFADSRDHMFLLGVVQMLWDRTEPNGFAPYITRDPLPGTPTHEIFMRAALGDHQVANLGAHIMARSMGMPHIPTGEREIFGLEQVQPPAAGLGYVEYDFGLPPDPVHNIPQRECEDPHGKLRKLEPARQQLDTFLRTGMIDNFCGACSFPEMSGC